jgi:hypothetical protein
MPFSQVFPRSFCASSISTFAPAGPGIYGLSNAKRWIAIAEAENLQQTLLALCAASGSAPTGERPTGFVIEICEPALRATRLHRLVQEYQPAPPPGRRHG